MGWWIFLGYVVIGAFAARWMYADSMEDGDSPKESAILALWFGALWGLFVPLSLLWDFVVWFGTGRHRALQKKKAKALEKKAADAKARIDAISFWTRELEHAQTDASSDVARMALEALTKEQL